MQINERKAGRERRNTADFNRTAPFLTREGLVFTDRRRGATNRRQVDMDKLLEICDVEEIVLQPLRLG